MPESSSTRAALQRTEALLERFRFALDESSIVAMTDVSGTITYANDKFCEISKYSRDELIGADHRLVNSGFHPKDFIREMWRTIAQGKVWRGELRNVAKDGTVYWVDTTIVPLLKPDGRPEQYLAIRNDITEKKRVEALLRTKETMAQLGQMATVIAHEVRNPLAGISGAIQVIAARLPQESREVQILRDVIERVKSLDEVLSGLLDFARPREAQLRPCSVRDIVEQASMFFRDTPSHQGIRFDITGPDLKVQADPQLLGRALLNLVMNAAQAVASRERSGEEGGIIGNVRVEITERHNEVILAVVDDGPGLGDGVKEQLFHPFFTTKIKGTGLGLAVVKQAVDAHHGRIEVSGKKGETRFAIHLPRHTSSGLSS
ncbi:MAG TPA: PAS domain S-box protein [Myxococcota bacterium]|nr:PAS domain S-box protein [Myxococcota bacterium]